MTGETFNMKEYFINKSIEATLLHIYKYKL